MNSDFDKFQTHKDIGKRGGKSSLDDLEVKSFDDVYQKKRHIKGSTKDKEQNDKQLNYLQSQVEQTRLRSGSSCDNILNEQVLNTPPNQS